MKIYRLDRQQWLTEPLDKIFGYFESPENLARITPPSLDFTVLTPAPIRMEQGRIIDYSIRFLGLPLRWRSIISTYRAPDCFVDEQLNGPFSFWFHRHQFKREQGGTLVIDQVSYAMPAFIPSPLTELIHRFLVRPRLESIFNFRRDQFDRLFNRGCDVKRSQSIPIACSSRSITRSINHGSKNLTTE